MSGTSALDLLPTNDPVDFTRSIPPLPDVFGDILARTLHRIADMPGLALDLRNGLAGGSAEDRQAGAAWLSPRFGQPIAPERIAVTNGTQSALLLLFEALVGKDGLLLAETLSYGVLADLARRAHLRLEGLPIDEEGILPDAFEQACREKAPRALYLNPTVHNPTTAVMSAERRLALAGTARRHGVSLIEDDPLGMLHPEAPPPIAALAPDVTWYVMGLTKCLAHGLRIAYLVGPGAVELDLMIGPARRLSHWFPAPLAAGVATRWIGSGDAAAICAAIRSESLGRQQLASAILPEDAVRTKAGAMHLWLQLPPGCRRGDFTRRLASRGVLARPSDLFAVDAAAGRPEALRLSLSSPLERQAVRHGLLTVAEELERHR